MSNSDKHQNGDMTDSSEVNSKLESVKVCHSCPITAQYDRISVGMPIVHQKCYIVRFPMLPQDEESESSESDELTDSDSDEEEDSDDDGSETEGYSASEDSVEGTCSFIPDARPKSCTLHLASANEFCWMTLKFHLTMA